MQAILISELAIKLIIMKSRYKNLLIGVLGSIFLAVLIYAFFNQSQGVPGNLFVISYLAHLGVLWLGIFAFFVRLFRLAPLPLTIEKILDGINNPGRFFYIFMGTSNLLIGLGAIILNFLGFINRNILFDLWPHIVVGPVLLIDSFVITTNCRQHFS
jgi:hypothetical protein